MLPDTIMSEFGDLHADAPVGTEASQEEVVPVDSNISAGSAEDDIALAEMSQSPDSETTVELEA
jgi:hypothetical protein